MPNAATISQDLPHQQFLRLYLDDLLPDKFLYVYILEVCVCPSKRQLAKRNVSTNGERK